ncbi:MAG TPA: RHS repeat-associated core domain-containing protein [Fluviicola sp.]|nr:RHS repeat-associated core domain-containing protein [Fluviicola sp.]
MKSIIILLLALLLLPLQSKAAVETAVNRIEAAQITTSGAPQLTVFDNKYVTMATNVSWPSLFTNYRIINKIRLGINPEVLQTNNLSGGVTISIKYWKWDVGTSAFVTSTESKTLSIDYSTTGTNIINDISTYVASDALRMEISITSINGGLDVDDAYLEAEIETERYYAFAGTAPASYSVAKTSDYVNFEWTPVVGAEYYELEWVHVNDYKADDLTNTFATSDLTYNFYRNSTRVIIKTPYYTIPRVFDRGYLVYRVRAIGMAGTEFNLRKEGSWSLGETGLISAATVNVNYVYIDTEFDTQMNWGHQVKYAEDGKRFEGVSYADGIGRMRQSVGSNPETGQAIVSNIYYDAFGRPTLTDLPTPDDDGRMIHRPDFNKAPGDTYYGAAHFEQVFIEDDPSCSFQTTPFSTSFGAGKYYSPNNPDQDGENVRIPDAEQYPFARVEYMDDHTGRIRRAGGIGPDFQIGSGHETEFFYGTPSQEEIDRLFGSEVGYAPHYQRRITVDANEQIYIEYFDMAGRVVASGLAGGTPANLDALDNNATFTLTQTITEGVNGDVTPTSMTLTKPLTIFEDEDYTFSYSLDPEEFTDETCTPELCLDCMYKLTVEITKEECDDLPVFSHTLYINGGEYDAMCNEDSPFAFDTTVTLLQNNYILTKTLTVDQDAINGYWCTYLESNTCVPTFQELYNEAYANADFSSCDVEDVFDEDDYSCDVMRAIMLNDVSPGGQYAEYTVSGSTYSAANTISVLYTGGSPDLSGDWRNPSGGMYEDELGSQAWVEVQLVGVGVYAPPVVISATPVLVDADNNIYKVKPEELANLADFVVGFQDSWAEALLPYHPEYCYLEYCEDNEASHAYDAAMGSITSFSEACSGGYFAPLGYVDLTVNYATPEIYSGCATTGAIDPFFEPLNISNPLYVEMKDRMDNYITISGVSVSMWEYAAMLVHCEEPYITFSGTTPISCLRDYQPGECELDMIWITFRDLYLAEKARIYAEAESEHIAGEACATLTATIGDEDPGNPFGEAIPHWGFYDDLTAEYSNTTDIQNAFDAQSEAACETVCTAYARDWMLLLSGCDIDTADTLGIFLDLKALCEFGCGDDHPAGATTLPASIPGGTYALPSGIGSIGDGATINDILALHGYSESDLCTELLISDPGPYQESLTEDVYLDECGCELLLTTKDQFENGEVPEGIETVEQLLEYNTGLSMEDIDQLICKCDDASANEWIPGGYEWTSGQIETILGWEEAVPQELTCDGCVQCEDVTTGVADLETRFGSEISESPNYEVILTNYLNGLFDFDLTYSHYAEFMLKCNSSNLNPICEPSPELLAWRDVMNLLAHRGQLTEDEEIDLLAENIVYKESELYEYLLATGYYSTLTAGGIGVDPNTLSQHFVKEGGNLKCSTSVTLPYEADFTFDDIVAFGHIVPENTGCSPVSTHFTVEVSYYDCGILKTAILDGLTECFPIQICYCGGDLMLCNESVNEQLADETPCYEPILSQLYQDVTEVYDAAIAAAKLEFAAAYNAKCDDAFETELLQYTGPFNQYQYTLFYYDQAGNLVKTVAPKGVTPLVSTSAVVTSRDATTDIDNQDPAAVPTHGFETEYTYNSYSQLVETANPDQVGSTVFFYDRYGRMVASQNPVQADENKYSYVLYDAQGRPVETGQIDRDVSPTPIAALSESTHLKVNDLGVAFKAWVYSGLRTEVTFTVYDKTMSGTVDALFAAGSQQNLRLRVASVVYFDAVSAGTMPTTGYVSATHYSYDLHGNVIESLQDVPALTPAQQDVKSTQYQFELLSGNVKKVEYQKGQRDRMTHEYLYDKLNRLTEVFTSVDDGVHKSRDAHYRYFDYGPLSRVEIGQHKVQGNDFTYTIHGWLKGMNSTVLDRRHDAGRDGGTGYLASNPEANAWFARDVSGYMMGYYDGDYQSIGTTTFEAAIGTSNPLSSAIKSLYNGNIAYTTTAIDGFDVQAGVYTYDQLNRLKAMNVYRSSTIGADNDWSNSANTTEYESAYTYDANGNLQTLVRNGIPGSGMGISMDDFTYNYTSGTNRLHQVSDAVTAASTLSYLEDINDGQGTNNYVYDKLGQLIEDNTSSEEQEYEWRFGDKKLNLQQSSTQQLEFVYNPMGQRVLKILKPVSGGVPVHQDDLVTWAYTYYSYDANGKLMAIYDVVMNDYDIDNPVYEATNAEQLIYGAGRIGVIKPDKVTYTNQRSLAPDGPIWKNQLGKKNYELTNHLGNVNAVITDRKTVNASYTGFSFASSVEGWAAGADASVSQSGGLLNVTTTPGSNNSAFKLMTTVVGESYIVTVKANKGTTTGLKLFLFGISTTNLADGETSTISFTATSTSTALIIQPLLTSGSYSFSIDTVGFAPKSVYEAVVILKSDYYPFGMRMPAKLNGLGDVIGGHWQLDYYRFGYNGMEKDPEMKGDGNSYTTEFRQYDPRLGRWASLDPLMKQFPWQSPYCAFDDNPVFFTDPYGLSATNPGDGGKKGKDGGVTIGSLMKRTPAQKAMDKAMEKYWDKKASIEAVVITPKRDPMKDGPKVLAKTSKSLAKSVKNAASGLTGAGWSKYDENWHKGSSKFVDGKWHGNSTYQTEGGLDIRNGDDEYSDDDFKPGSSAHAVYTFMPILPGSIAGDADAGGQGQKLKYKQKDVPGTDFQKKVRNVLETKDSGSDTWFTRSADMVDELSSMPKPATAEEIMVNVVERSSFGSLSMERGPFINIEEAKKKYPSDKYSLTRKDGIYIFTSK